MKKFEFIIFNSDNTSDTELLHISIETRLEITAINKFQYFVLIEVTSKNIIMIIVRRGLYLRVKVYGVSLNMHRVQKLLQ